MLKHILNFSCAFSNSTVNLKYKINTSTNIQRAELIYKNTRIPLASAGIFGRYTFLNPDIPSIFKDTIRIIFFTLDNNLKSGESTLIFLNKDPNSKYQCILSSSNS